LLQVEGADVVGENSERGDESVNELIYVFDVGCGVHDVLMLMSKRRKEDAGWRQGQNGVQPKLNIGAAPAKASLNDVGLNGEC
jgi:hypothetical protein